MAPKRLRSGSGSKMAVGAEVAKKAKVQTASEGSVYAATVAFGNILRSAESQRNQFQAKLGETVADLKSLAGSKQKVVDDIATRLSELEVAKADASKQVFELFAKRREVRLVQEESESALGMAKGTLAAAKRAYDAEMDVVGSIDAERQQCVANRAGRQSFFEDIWEPLKCVGTGGRNWREKKKQVEMILDMLRGRDVEVSCINALPASLKEHPDNRGAIATKCIEHVEGELRNSVKEFSEMIKSYESSKADKLVASEGATAKLAEAQSRKDVVENEYIATSNVLLEATEEYKAADRLVKELTRKTNELKHALLAAQKEHNEVLDKLLQFEIFGEKTDNDRSETEEVISVKECPPAKVAEEKQVVA